MGCDEEEEELAVDVCGREYIVKNRKSRERGKEKELLSKGIVVAESRRGRR